MRLSENERTVMGMAEYIGKTQPAVVAPVRHGRVVETIEDGRMKRIFSCCRTDCTERTCWMTANYCPNCGAKMDEEVSE